MSSQLDITEARSMMSKYIKGLDEPGCYYDRHEHVAPVVVFKHGKVFRLANPTPSDSYLELQSHDKGILNYADYFESPDILSNFTTIANGCSLYLLEMVVVADTLYPIYLAKGRVDTKGYCPNLTHSLVCFATCKGTRITMGPVAAALFNPRV